MAGASSRSETWRRARSVLDRAREVLLASPGVTGVDLGLRLRASRLTSDVAIRVHVLVKGRDSKNTRQLPSSIEGVPIDVIQASYRSVDDTCPSTWPHSVRDPLVGGVAIGRRTHRNVGTLAAVVVDSFGERFGLTADHVVRSAGVPEPVVQPPSASRPVADPVRSLFDADADAALIHLRPERSVLPGVRGGPILGVLDPIPRNLLPLAVVVVGGCSGLTSGFVTGTDFAGVIDYDSGPMEVRRQLHLRRKSGQITRPGDSGALILEPKSRRAVGLVRAGEAQGSADYCIASPIASILARLDVSFL